MAVAALVLSLLAVIVAIVGGWIAYRSAKPADRSADEAAKTRGDALGPSITVGSEQPLRERWNFVARGLPDSPVHYPPGVAEPDKQFVCPANVDIRLLMGAHVMLANEGERTTKVAVTAFRVDRCDNFDDREKVLSPPAELPDGRVVDGRLTLEPGDRVGVIVRVGPTVGEWLDAGSPSQPTCSVEIEAQTSPDGARQHWSLDLTAELLWPVTGNASAYRVVPHRPPDLKLTELSRTYGAINR